MYLFNLENMMKEARIFTKVEKLEIEIHKLINNKLGDKE